ncbi:MAG: bifunctional hydroxymethylpyrimidine kinase/phosphomethylpyrimidine kinase [bacterium]
MKKEDVVLTITAFDPSCGAGIGQDIKIFTTLGLNGCGVATSIISQTKTSIKSMKFFSGEEVKIQLNTIFEEFIPLSLKIGIVGTRDILQSIKNVITSFRYNKYIVIDPVFISTSGYSLSNVDIKEIIYTFIDLPIIITPNREELFNIIGKDIDDPYESLLECYKELNKPILLTGIKSEEYIKDILIFNDNFYEFTSPLVKSDFHDMGGALSSAVAGFLSKGYGIIDSISHAKTYFDKLLSYSLQNRWLLNVGLYEYLSSKINEAKENLSEFAIDICSLEGISELIPECGINTGILVSDNDGLETVVVFDRNIFPDRRLGITRPPQGIVDNFCPLSNILITCHRKWKDVNTIMNIKINEKISTAINKTGLFMLNSESQNKIQDRLSKEIQSVEFSIKNLKINRTPDVISYKGYPVKEPMILLFAPDINSLYDKILLIISEMRTDY